ncbi:MAG: hypothetical protein VKK04_12845 [Synechococcales bacterium]|nr:hypothetical protein [Synechococcales bacterium]
MSHRLYHSSRNQSRRLTTAPGSKSKLFQPSRPTAQTSRKTPWSWVVAGGLASLLVAAVPLLEWYRSAPVLAILALDVSDSGLADGKSVEDICRSQTKFLKARDQAIDFVYADTTEPTLFHSVNSPIRSYGRCKPYASSRPGTVGQGWGTSPILLLERVYTQVQIQHQQGKVKPAAITVWLDAAEPGSELPPLDFSVLGQQIQQLNELQAQIAIVGPTGELREELERLSLANPNLRVCGLPDAQECIRSTFAAARALAKH